MSQKGIFKTVILVSLIGLLLSACTFYQEGRYSVTENNVSYTASNIKKVCFADHIQLPKDATEVEITVPDRISTGHLVEGIGGYVGSGAPVPCSVGIADTELEIVSDTEAITEYTTYTVTLKLGKHIDKLSFFDFITRSGEETCQYFLRKDTEEIIKIQMIFQIDPQNEHMTSIDGILYYKRDLETVGTDTPTSIDKKE